MDKDKENTIPTISANIQEEQIYPPIHLQDNNNGGTLLTDQVRVRETWSQLDKDLSYHKKKLDEENIFSICFVNDNGQDCESNERKILRNAIKEELVEKENRKSVIYPYTPNFPAIQKSKSAPQVYPTLEVKEVNGLGSTNQKETAEDSIENVHRVSVILESTKSDQSFDPNAQKCMLETLPIDELMNGCENDTVQLRKNNGILYRSVSEIIQEDFLKCIEEAPKFGIRHWQILLYSFVVFLGLGFRVTMSVGIVAMTDPSVSSNEEIPTYDWTDQSVILGAFFWGYIIPQIFAGWLAYRYGPKWFLISAMFTCSAVSLTIPAAAASLGSVGVMICRAIQGFSQGFFFPSLHHVISQWVPTSERSRLGGFVYAANPIGTVVCLVVSGSISASDLGWPWVFYLYGIVGLIWCIISACWAYNCPQDCPFISFAEKACIENSLGHKDKGIVHKTPWRKIATSLPVWAIVITMFGQNWGFWTLITEIPLYLNNVMKFNIQENSILTALPYLVVWILSFGMNYSCDKLIAKKYLSIGAARKLFNSIGLVFPAIALILLGHTSADNPERAVFLLVVAVGLNAGTYCGYLVNHVDIAPNHAGVLMGITNCLSNTSGFLAPMAVQHIVKDMHDPTQWKVIFFLAAAIYLVTNAFFVIFGSGNVQSWNEEDKRRDLTKNGGQ